MSASGSLYIGAISGTSMDGLDLALVDMGSGRPAILSGKTVEFPPELRARMGALAACRDDDVDTVGIVDQQMGRFSAIAIVDFLRELDFGAGEVAAIGFHGQTIRHRPDGPWPFTLQIGDPNLIAEHTGIATVADFRRRDLAAGGQGAPLVPPFHAALLGDARARVVLNIGGIGNITVLPAGGASPVTGFDTGPGNALLDAWITRHHGKPYDRAGAWAASGRVDRQLLERLLVDPYFDRRPPKSTGKEHFNIAWIDQRLSPPYDPADVQATLAALTAETIAVAIKRWGTDDGLVVVCGGGRLNACLMGFLTDALPTHDLQPSEALGVGGDWIEAAAFAWLAARRMAQLPGNEPAVTGARGARVLGALYHP
jgi:anhydro-N-acetylmuramic acid kinase